MNCVIQNIFSAQLQQFNHVKILFCSSVHNLSKKKMGSLNCMIPVYCFCTNLMLVLHFIQGGNLHFIVHGFCECMELHHLVLRYSRDTRTSCLLHRCFRRSRTGWSPTVQGWCWDSGLGPWPLRWRWTSGRSCCVAAHWPHVSSLERMKDRILFIKSCG